MLPFCDLLPPNTIFTEPTREERERDERAIVVLLLQKKGMELDKVKYNVLKDSLSLRSFDTAGASSHLERVH